MVVQNDEGTKVALLSAGQGSWLDDLAWGLLPLGLWGLLLFCLLAYP